ncbi:MAG: outer membrane protein assembly factor BamA [Nannocystaceae bacterium]
MSRALANHRCASRAHRRALGGVQSPADARPRAAQRASAPLQRAAARVLAVLVALSVVLGGAGEVLAGPSLIPPIANDAMFKALVLEEVDADLYGQPIAEIRFEGNRRVESEAMLLEMESKVGELVKVTSLASDLKRLWGLGKFEDVAVYGEMSAAGVVLTYKVVERPTIRKIVVEGNDKVKLDDINEVLDLTKNAILDLGVVKANVEKVKGVYVEGGFFLADVDYAIRPVEGEVGKVDVYIVVNEASEVVVRSVTFVGNQAIPDEDLRNNMNTRVGGYLTLITKRAGGVFNREMFGADYQLLRSYYADQGYLDANFKDPELALSADRRFVHVTIPVEEGPQYRVGRIRAKEVLPRGEEPLFEEAVLAESITPILAEGDVASMGKVNTIVQDIERRYKDSGYAYVNVIPDARQDKEKLLLYMTLEVGKGPLVYIERINIYGNDKTADKVIRREMILNEGSLYSETGKELSEFNVLRLGFFNDVTISTSKGSADDKIVLNVEVTERLTGTFQVGAGFSTIENFVLQAQVQYDNFLGRGTAVTLVAQMSSLRRLFNLSYYTRYFLDSRWNFQFNVFNTRNIFPSFARDSSGFRFSWGYPIPKLPNLIFFAGYSFEYVDVSFGNTAFGNAGGIFAPGTLYNIPEGALITNLFSNGITSSLETRVRYDTTDNYLFPTRGMRHELRAEFANKYLGSQNLFNRYNAAFRFYFPIIKSKAAFRAWVVFKTQLQIGYIHSLQPNGVPIYERYFPGGIFGAGMIRGYRLRSLGPRILVQSSSDPTAALIAYGIGGNLLAALNAELEFMIVPPANIKGVLFFDTGNAFNTESVYCTEEDTGQLPKADPCDGFSLRNMRYSMGFGVRWQSPIGPLRFEWGFPLDRLSGTEYLRQEDPVVFEFNVGNSF